MLTPDYASPEQVRGRAVTTASDVYALGVVLYELVSGRRPYHVETPEPAELLRLVCEQDPPKPSTVAVASELRGDLDAIVMKSMRKEPEQRYASAAALSEDIERYLEARPVVARRGSTGYRAKKFIRRHRLGAAATALVLVALAGGVWATLREARRAREAEARAERRFKDVRTLANSFLFEFHDAIRDLPGSTPARALVVQRALEYLDSLSKESGGDRALRREVAEAYRRVGDVQGNPFAANLGDLRGALSSYGKAIALLEPAVQAPGATDDERATLASCYLVGGGLLVNQGKAAEALASAKKAWPCARRSPRKLRTIPSAGWSSRRPGSSWRSTQRRPENRTRPRRLSKRRPPFSRSAFVPPRKTARRSEASARTSIFRGTRRPTPATFRARSQSTGMPSASRRPWRPPSRRA
jgi:non-specific serine/threonine protein kinase/serine/threonine-protein kinase